MSVAERIDSGSSQVAVRIVVFAINLSYNGLPEETEEEPNEEEPGGFIILNDNDNAGGANPGETNGVPDNQEASFAHADPDLKPVSLSLMPSDFANGVVTLSAPSVLRVWSDQKKTDSVSQWDLAEDEMPTAMYIEGYSTGSGDLTLSYNGIIPCADTVKITVMKLELTMAEYLGVDLTDPTGKVSSATASIVVEPSGFITNYYWTLTGKTTFTNDVKQTNTTASGMTVYETGEGSTGYKGESINVQVLPSGFSAHTNFTVVKANIDWPGVTETNEETIGAWVKYNGDDDDTNGVIDALQDAMENGIEDDDLVEIELTLKPTNLPTNETVLVTCEGCWLDRQKLTNAAGEFTANRFPLTVYVEGMTISQTPRDQFITVSNSVSAAVDMVKYTVYNMEFVYAQGEKEGQPMKRLPIFTPSDGVGMGMPIYDVPEPPLRVEFGDPLDQDEIDSFTATFFGRELTVTETATNSMVFVSQDETLTLELESPPEFEADETIICWVDDVEQAITNARYMLISTDNDYTVFESLTLAFELTAPVWSETETNQIVFCDNVLFETGIGTRVFTNATYEVAVLDGAPQTAEVDEWRIAFTDGWYGEGAVFKLEETGLTTLVFRNCAPPIATDRPPSEPEDYVPWRIKIEGIDVGLVEDLTLESSLEQLVINDFVSGSILTAAKFVLVPPGTTVGQVPGGDYTLLHIDPLQIGVAINPLQLIVAKLNLKVSEQELTSEKAPSRNAQILRSFNRSDGLWTRNISRLFGKDLVGSVKDLGYSVLPNNDASREWALSNVGGKDVVIWYSHGGWPGVYFTDKQAQVYGDPSFEMVLQDGAVKPSDLEGLDLDVRFALMVACASAWTGGATLNEARNLDTVHPKVKECADKLGPSIAYVGFSWKERHQPAADAACDFLKLLKGGRTVREALAEYDKRNPDYKGRFKGYGAGLDSPVDAKYLDSEVE